MNRSVECARACIGVAVGLVLLVGAASAAAQGVPSPANSTLPPMIALVGSTNGVPAALGAFEVVVRDLANNPVPGAAVIVDLSLAYDLHFCVDPLDPGVTAGFATEYSGMRFGFFFFAEYVNVFIVSALTVALFFGGWNAPFPFPELSIPLDPGALGIWLLIGIAVVPVLGTLALSLPFFLTRSDMPAWQALVLGFVLFNVVAIGLVLAWAYVSFAWVAGLIWFLMKSYFFVFTFVWMRATLPRIRIDQLMGFAWKWLMPAALLNLFVTAGAILVVGR